MKKEEILKEVASLKGSGMLIKLEKVEISKNYDKEIGDIYSLSIAVRPVLSVGENFLCELSDIIVEPSVFFTSEVFRVNDLIQILHDIANNFEETFKNKIPSDFEKEMEEITIVKKGENNEQSNKFSEVVKRLSLENKEDTH